MVFHGTVRAGVQNATIVIATVVVLQALGISISSSPGFFWPEPAGVSVSEAASSSCKPSAEMLPNSGVALLSGLAT